MRILFSAVLLLLLAVTTQAALPEELSKTFQPIDGVIIKVVDGEYLLDLGSENGVRNGDLISVMAPGEAVKHPVTGAVIGHIDQAKTFLRIVRIKPDFSWARPLSADVVIRPADAVRRFGEVPTLFIPADETDHALFNDLQTALPHLAWQPWSGTTLTGPGLIFSHDHQGITVRDEIGTLLASWPLTPEKEKTVNAVASPVEKMIVIGPKFKGKAIGLAIADLDGNGRPEIAVALDDRIEIGRYDGKEWIPVARFALPDAIKPLTLDSADLDGNGRFELLITAVRGEKLTSQVWGYDGTTYRLLAKNLPWYWRVMDLPEEEKVTLGQAADSFEMTRYADKPFRIIWQDGAPQQGERISTFVAPTLHGSQPFIAPKQGTLWAWLDSHDKLSILDGDGLQLWQGNEDYGGGEAFIEEKTRRMKDESRRLFIRSRLGLQGETLVLPQNDGPRTLNNRRQAEKSRLTALRWNGYQLEKVWESPTRDGYLADFAYGDVDNDGQPEFLLVGTLPTGFFSGTESALFVWKK